MKTEAKVRKYKGYQIIQLHDQDEVSIIGGTEKLTDAEIEEIANDFELKDYHLKESKVYDAQRGTNQVKYHHYLLSYGKRSRSYPFKSVLEKLDHKAFPFPSSDNRNYENFRVLDHAMNGNSLFDVPAGALILGKEICTGCIEEAVGRAKTGFVINWKGKYLHRDVAIVDDEKEEIICTSRNPEEQQSITVKYDDVEQIFEVIARQF